MLPQLLLLALYVLSLGIHLAQHGQPKKGNESFPAGFVAVALQVGLLYWGGFFNGLIALTR